MSMHLLEEDREAAFYNDTNYDTIDRNREKPMKLSELNRHCINVAHQNAQTVLCWIKRHHTLTGRALKDMQTLEVAVQNLEIFQMNMK